MVLLVPHSFLPSSHLINQYPILHQIRRNKAVNCCLGEDASDGQSPSERKPRYITNEQIRKSLLAVEKSLLTLARVVDELSSAVRCMAEALESDEMKSTKLPSQTNELDQLSKRNAISHGLAYRLQQAFIQCRIEGLGKPFEVAADEFYSVCKQARSRGISMMELQLQLILADGALSGAYAVMTDNNLKSMMLDEETRVRSSWVRYVYRTLSKVDGSASNDNSGLKEEDAIDAFVDQLIKAATDEGYTLEQLKSEQENAGPPLSNTVKTLRQSSYIILLTFERASRNTG